MPSTETSARQLLEFYVESGANAAVAETPFNRFATVEAPVPRLAPQPRASEARIAPAAAPLASPASPDVAALAARDAVAGVTTLEELRAALEKFEGCALKATATQLVFADGNPQARVMLVGEAPGRDEDIAGRPFVGRAGQLLDRMFAAIGLSRQAPDPGGALYITNVMPWRPPQNREPQADEIAMMLPFLARHVELAAPDLIVLMGNTPCAAVLARKGILRLRGQWTEGFGRPVLPMTHPAYLLRNPAAKREAWADLLEIGARLRG